jgi:hypothetical protein
VFNGQVPMENAMTDDTGQAPTPEPQAGDGQQAVSEQPQAQEPATVWTPETAAAEIKALRAEAAKYRKEREAAVKAQADADAARLAEQGKYKELYEATQARLSEFEPLKERYDTVISQVQAANEARIKAIPETMRSLVPEYDDPLKTAAWLDANSTVFQKVPPPQLDGRAGGHGGGSVTVTDDEVQAFATRMGIPVEYVDRATLAKAYKG